MSAIHETRGIKTKSKDELCFDDKLKILSALARNGVKIDFSGGDPLFYEDDFNVVSIATEIMPRDYIDVSMTGCNFTRKKLHLLKKVGKVEMTVDNVPGSNNLFRPRGFNSSALKALEILAGEGVFCSAVTTLYSATASKERLSSLYSLLCSKGIPKWNILRFYPVGRGARLASVALSIDELLDTMNFLESLRGSTEIVFQHSLRLLKGEYQCHAATKSIGILPDGTVLACGWALDENSRPLGGFELGKLPEGDLKDILENAQGNLGYRKRQDYCRIMNHLGQ